MKQLFSLLLLFVGALSASANSITDLFGTYTFTADMAVTELGKQYADKFTNNCEVTICADPYGIYLASIEGLAGSTKSGLKVSSYENNRMIIHNWNDSNTGNFDGPIYFSTEMGYNPFCPDAPFPDFAPTWDSYYKVINLPKFTLVTVSDYDAYDGQILATFTNCKLTPKDKEEVEIIDLSGDYQYIPGSGEYDYRHNTAWANDFTFTLEKTKKTNNGEYAVYFQYPSLDPFTLIGTFDGHTLTIPFAEQLLLYINDTQSLYLGDYDGFTVADIVFNLDNEGRLINSSGFSIVRVTSYSDGTLASEKIQWFYNGYAEKIAEEPVEVSGNFSFTGKYYTPYDSEGMDRTIAMTFTPWNGDIYVDYFDGTVIYDLYYGGITATVVSNQPTVVTIPAGTCFKVYNYSPADNQFVYEALYDKDGGMNPIEITLHADHTATINECSIYAYDFMTKQQGDLLGWFGENTAVGVNTALTTTPSAPHFDLSGRRISPSTPGLHIVNGKKIIF